MTDIVDVLRDAQKGFVATSFEFEQLFKQAADTIERLRYEKDQAIKEANRRDQKWKDGIEQICGCKIDFCGLGGSHLKTGPPTLVKFIQDLKRKAELGSKFLELLKESGFTEQEHSRFCGER